jgi:hypothetical protein
LDVGDQARQKTTAKPIGKRKQGFCVPIRGNHYLFVRTVEMVKGVKELVLQTFLVFDELNVVD